MRSALEIAEMVPTLGVKGSFRSVGAHENQSLGALNLPDAVEPHGTMLPRNLAGLPWRDGEEQLVIFSPVQGEVPSIGRRDDAFVVDRSPDLLLAEERPNATRGAEVCEVGGKAIAHIDQRGGQAPAGKKTP
jgi:hypothetical protein